MGIFKRKNRVDRQVALGLVEDAMGRVQEPTVHLEPAEPSPIHNPGGGTRWHYLDPDTGLPVCKASGIAWATGHGGLRKCGLCPAIWAQRHGDQVAS